MISRFPDTKHSHGEVWHGLGVLPRVTFSQFHDRPLSHIAPVARTGLGKGKPTAGSAKVQIRPVSVPGPARKSPDQSDNNQQSISRDRLQRLQQLRKSSSSRVPLPTSSNPAKDGNAAAPSGRGQPPQQPAASLRDAVGSKFGSEHMVTSATAARLKLISDHASMRRGQQQQQQLPQAHEAELKPSSQHHAKSVHAHNMHGHGIEEDEKNMHKSHQYHDHQQTAGSFEQHVPLSQQQQQQQQQQERRLSRDSSSKRDRPSIAFGTRKEELKPSAKRRRPMRQANDENVPGQQPKHANGPVKLPRVARLTVEELRRDRRGSFLRKSGQPEET